MRSYLHASGAGRALLASVLAGLIVAIVGRVQISFPNLPLGGPTPVSLAIVVALVPVVALGRHRAALPAATMLTAVRNAHGLSIGIHLACALAYVGPSLAVPQAPDPVLAVRVVAALIAVSIVGGALAGDGGVLFGPIAFMLASFLFARVGAEGSSAWDLLLDPTVAPLKVGGSALALMVALAFLPRVWTKRFLSQVDVS